MDDLNEKLGRLVDTAENYLALMESYMTATMKVDALQNGLIEIRDQLKQIYFSNGGEDVWK